MKGYIDGCDFYNLEAMKYYAAKAGDSTAKDKAMQKVMSGDFLGSRKMDGYFGKFVKDEDGNMFLLSRSRGTSGDFGEKIDKVPHLHKFFEELPNGTCFLGELYFPTHEGSSEVTKVLGSLTPKAIKRQENDPIHFYIFDCLASDGESWLGWRAEERFDELNAFARAYEFENVEWARYMYGEELWEYIGKVLASGGEGVVITHKDALYMPGKRSSKITLKIKKEVSDTIDAFVINYELPTRLSGTTDIENWMYWENAKSGERYNDKLYKEYKAGAPIEPVTKGWFYDWAGSFIFGAYTADGKIKPVCKISGLTEEVLSNFESYKGKVAEISAMEILETKGLRHPRLLQWRDDKTASDCKWEEIFNA